MNLNAFPQVEYWTDTNWEAYKGAIQQEIRDHMDPENRHSCLALQIDLDNGIEDWMYTAHLFPRKQVPTRIVEPVAQNMMENAQDKNLFTRRSNIWICGHQSHKTKQKIRLIRCVMDNNHMAELEFGPADSSSLPEPVRGAGAGVYPIGLVAPARPPCAPCGAQPPAALCIYHHDQNTTTTTIITTTTTTTHVATTQRDSV